MTHSVLGTLGKVFVLAALLTACGGESDGGGDDEPTAGRGGSAGDAGNDAATGGRRSTTTAKGGKSSTGGDDEPVAGRGGTGDSGGNGNGNVGGSSAVDPADVAALEDACSDYCKTAAAQTQCSEQPAAAACQMNCETASTLIPTCTNQLAGIYRCYADAPTSDWECDDTGAPTPSSTICMTEAASVLTCVSGGNTDPTDVTPIEGVEELCAKMADSGCDNAPTESECASQFALLSMVATGCDNEISALFTCYSKETFTCDSSGEPTPADSSACAAETTAVEGCTGQ